MSTQATVKRFTERIDELQAALANARAAVVEAQRQAAEIERQIRSYEAVIEDIQAHPYLLDVRRGGSKEVRNTAMEVLRDVGRPTHFREILQLVTDRGVQVGGQDPVRNFAAHLSADTRFVSVGDGFWALTSWPPQSRQTPDKGRDREPSTDQERDSSGITRLVSTLGDLKDDGCGMILLPTWIQASDAPAPGASASKNDRVAGEQPSLRVAQKADESALIDFDEFDELD